MAMHLLQLPETTPALEVVLVLHGAGPMAAPSCTKAQDQPAQQEQQPARVRCERAEGQQQQRPANFSQQLSVWLLPGAPKGSATGSPCTSSKDPYPGQNEGQSGGACLCEGEAGPPETATYSAAGPAPQLVAVVDLPGLQQPATHLAGHARPAAAAAAVVGVVLEAAATSPGQVVFAELELRLGPACASPSPSPSSGSGKDRHEAGQHGNQAAGRQQPRGQVQAWQLVRHRAYCSAVRTPGFKRRVAPFTASALLPPTGQARAMTAAVCTAAAEPPHALLAMHSTSMAVLAGSSAAASGSVLGCNVLCSLAACTGRRSHRVAPDGAGACALQLLELIASAPCRA